MKIINQSKDFLFDVRASHTILLKSLINSIFFLVIGFDEFELKSFTSNSEIVVHSLYMFITLNDALNHSLISHDLRVYHPTNHLTEIYFLT